MALSEGRRRCPGGSPVRLGRQVQRSGIGAAFVDSWLAQDRWIFVVRTAGTLRVIRSPSAPCSSSRDDLTTRSRSASSSDHAFISIYRRRSRRRSRYGTGGAVRSLRRGVRLGSRASARMPDRPGSGHVVSTLGRGPSSAVRSCSRSQGAAFSAAGGRSSGLRFPRVEIAGHDQMQPTRAVRRNRCRCRPPRNPDRRMSPQPPVGYRGFEARTGGRASSRGSGAWGGTGGP